MHSCFLTSNIVEIKELLSVTAFIVYDADNYPIPAKQLRQKNIATHELGHALGFAGHASEANIDVMYFEVRAVIYLSIRDREQVLQIWEYYTN